MKVAEVNGNGNGWAQRYSVIIQTVTVMGLFVGALWAAVIGPMQGEIHDLNEHKISDREHGLFVGDIDHQLKELKTAIDQRFQEEALQASKTVPHAVDEEHFRSLEVQIARLEKDFDNLKGGLVPHSADEEHFKDIEQRVEGLHDNYKELNNQFQSVYNAGDQLKALQKEVDDLRTQQHRDAISSKP